MIKQVTNDAAFATMLTKITRLNLTDVLGARNRNFHFKNILSAMDSKNTTAAAPIISRTRKGTWTFDTNNSEINYVQKVNGIQISISRRNFGC